MRRVKCSDFPGVLVCEKLSLLAESGTFLYWMTKDLYLKTIWKPAFKGDENQTKCITVTSSSEGRPALAGHLIFPIYPACQVSEHRGDNTENIHIFRRQHWKYPYIQGFGKQSLLILVIVRWFIINSSHCCLSSISSIHLSILLTISSSLAATSPQSTNDKIFFSTSIYFFCVKWNTRICCEEGFKK